MKTISARLLSIFFLMISVTACASVLNRTYMREGLRTVSFDELRKSPDQFKGTLYILGGIIVNSKFTEAGSQIEAVHVPVDGEGYFLEKGRSEGRFFAVLPGDRKQLDPAIFRRGRRITLAAAFIGTRQGKIDEMEYVYPVFEIKQIYLWPNVRYLPPPYYYDPWFYPYPYYYWEPWWSFYYYSAPVPSHPSHLVPSPSRREVPPLPPPPRHRREDESERR